MNYRHAFHAGNFADVFKHSILVHVVKTLAVKDKPFCYLDTHAGSGRYDLAGDAARKTGEYRAGVGRLFDLTDCPAEFSDYLACVRAFNPHGTLRYYPGSPHFAKHFARAQDRLVLCELHPEAYALLKQEFARDARVAVHLQDGYRALKAFLPPTERRGLVLIDPPYEAADEFERVAQALASAHVRWPSGIYAVWYPIKDAGAVARFHRVIRESGIREVLLAELRLYPDDSAIRMNGCGMLLVNPPWKTLESLRCLLPVLARLLRQDSDASFRAEWLVPE